MFGLGFVEPFGFCNGEAGFSGCDLSGLSSELWLLRTDQIVGLVS